MQPLEQTPLPQPDPPARVERRRLAALLAQPARAFTPALPASPPLSLSWRSDGLDRDRRHAAFG
jgi:hypothetical protein